MVRTLSHSLPSRRASISSVLGASSHCKPQFQMTVGAGNIFLSSESARRQLSAQCWQAGSMPEPVVCMSSSRPKKAVHTVATMK